MKASDDGSNSSSIDSLFHSGGLLASTTIEDCHGAIGELFRPLRGAPGAFVGAGPTSAMGGSLASVGQGHRSVAANARGTAPILHQQQVPSPEMPKGIIAAPRATSDWGLDHASSATFHPTGHNSAQRHASFAKRDVVSRTGGAGAAETHMAPFSALSELNGNADPLYPSIPPAVVPTQPSRYPSLQYNDMVEPPPPAPMRSSVPRHMGATTRVDASLDGVHHRPASCGSVFPSHHGHANLPSSSAFAPMSSQSFTEPKRHSQAGNPPGAVAPTDRNQYRRYLQEQHRMYADLLEKERREHDERSVFEVPAFDAASSDFLSNLAQPGPAFDATAAAQSRHVFGSSAHPSRTASSASSSRSSSPESLSVYKNMSHVPSMHSSGPSVDFNPQDRSYYSGTAGYQSSELNAGSAQYFPSSERSMQSHGLRGDAVVARAPGGKQLLHQQHLQQHHHQQLQNQNRRGPGTWISKDRYNSVDNQPYGASPGYVHQNLAYQQFGDKSQQRTRPRGSEVPGAQSRSHLYPDGLTFTLGGKTSNPPSRDFGHHTRSHGASSLKTMVLNMRGCLRVFKEASPGSTAQSPFPLASAESAAPPGFVFDTECSALRSKLFDFIGRREVHVILMYNTGCLREDDLRVIRSEVKSKFKTESAMWASFCCPPDEDCQCCGENRIVSHDDAEFGRGTAVLMLGPLAPRAGWVRSDSSVFPMPSSTDEGQQLPQGNAQPAPSSLDDLREHNKACGGLKFTFATVRIKAGYSDVVFMSCDLPMPQPDCLLTADCDMTVRWRNSVSKLATVLAEEQNKGKNLVLTGRILPPSDTKFPSSCQLSSIVVSEAIAVNAPVTQQHFVLDFLGIMVARGINLILVTNRGLLESDAFEADRFGISVFVSAGTIAQLPQLTPSGSASASRVATPRSTPPPTPPSIGCIPLRSSSLGTPLVSPPGSPPHPFVPARPSVASLGSAPLSGGGFEDELLRDDIISSALNSPGGSRSHSPYDFLKADPSFNGETYISSKLLDYQQMKSMGSANSASGYSGDVSASTSARTSRASSPVDMTRGRPSAAEISSDPASRQFAAHIRPQGIRTHLLPQNGMFPQSSFLRYMNQSVIDTSTVASTVKTDILESFSAVKITSEPNPRSSASPALVALELMSEVKGWPRKAYEFPSAAR